MYTAPAHQLARGSSTQCVHQATRSTWPTPCHDAKSCFSRPWASRHMSGPRTRNRHPILWLKSVSFGFNKQRGGLPKLVGPRASTILPCCASQYTLCQRDSIGRTLVLPWKMMGSWPGPSEYANVHTAWAPLSSNPARSLWNCWTPSDCMNHFLCRTLSLRVQRLELRRILHIWAGEFIPGVKAQACVFYKHGATNLDEIELNKSSVNLFL
jgi:hypothetical protein